MKKSIKSKLFTLTLAAAMAINVTTGTITVNNIACINASAAEAQSEDDFSYSVLDDGTISAIFWLYY